eukprot:CAMPEP_0113917298 /NCGR_PEP_ID=MMETSP0780_2-20120614/32652_1 /TAXON_ID=652834 /ORGANISM="Palpitomonas bilix" /LENGTH=34 /DNA_ID=CAMNT_0000916847 /DNA_START=67 /DNA_END=168 /DNA_ORIENTATION=+ /assembly_acc=CAM_ASM_000599
MTANNRGPAMGFKYLLQQLLGQVPATYVAAFTSS